MSLRKHIIITADFAASFFKRSAVKLSVFAILFLVCSSGFSQEEKKFIREGNKQYQNKNYIEAEKNYTRGLNKNKDSYKGSFNLGDSYYKQGKYSDAAEQFQML